MNHDLLLGIWLGGCFVLLACVKVVSWAVVKGGKLFMGWISKAL